MGVCPYHTFLHGTVFQPKEEGVEITWKIDFLFGYEENGGVL